MFLSPLKSSPSGARVVLQGWEEEDQIQMEKESAASLGTHQTGSAGSHCSGCPGPGVDQMIILLTMQYVFNYLFIRPGLAID